MLQLTARLFKDGQLIGYQATDGNSTANLTKQEAWMYAKHKQVFNVTASGTPEAPVLSGTNGFQLKNLPEIKAKSYNTGKPKKYEKHDVYASIVRKFISHPLLEHEKEKLIDLGKRLFREELEYGLINPEIVGTQKDSLVATARLNFSDTDYGHRGYPAGAIVKNVGSTPITFNRVITETLVITDETVTINPGQEVPMSNLELMILVARPEFSGAIANLILSLNGTSNDLRLLIRHSGVSLAVNADKIKVINVHDVVSEEQFIKYYKKYEQPRIRLADRETPEGDGSSQVLEQPQSQPQSKQNTSLFGMFSRK